MLKLIIDTSSEYCLLAISRERHLLASALFLHENRLSRSLVGRIAELAQEAAISLKELQSIAVGVGPGSYTGTRVGVAVAKGLGFGLRIPVRGYCSLLRFLPPCEGTFLCTLPAKSGLIYCLKGHRRQAITLQVAELTTPERMAALAEGTDFIYSKDCQPRFDAIVQLLEQPCTFTFEEKAELIYLHQAT
jgi:tRNA threonylcarbamoyl adenosine modification protein YeaZ